MLTSQNDLRVADINFNKKNQLEWSKSADKPLRHWFYGRAIVHITSEQIDTLMAAAAVAAAAVIK